MKYSKKNNSSRGFFGFLRITFAAVMIVVAELLVLMLITRMVYIQEPASGETVHAEDVAIMDLLDTQISEILTDAEQAARSVHKHFWIEEDTVLCPEPNQECYGQASSPQELQWLLEDAAELLNGQSTVFTTETPILEGSVINYYLDDSILAITWKQVFGNIVYTISEVKISDPSQFRRYLADDTYNAKRHYPVVKMSEMNNAVVASSADFYRNRNYGTVVYKGEALRLKNPKVNDVCFIDRSGDLQFTYRNEIQTIEALQEYVDQHDILFSLCFGPVLVDNGVQCNPKSYSIGEIHDKYPRAALCQQDKLHYLVMAVTAEGRHRTYHTIQQLADVVSSFGCQKAYTLDGGQTANIVMNDQLINNINYPTVRAQSDIIYFATAVPNQ